MVTVRGHNLRAPLLFIYLFISVRFSRRLVRDVSSCEYACVAQWVRMCVCVCACVCVCVRASVQKSVCVGGGGAGLRLQLLAYVVL